MSLEFRRRSELNAREIAGLADALAAFYRNPPPSYYQIADGSCGRYNPAERPFHCDLLNSIPAGGSVLEAGCGTAHLCPQVEARGGRYTGLDYSEELLDKNRRRFPQARFFSIGTALAETFDVVASLYTIEHVVDPPAYLEMLWKYCRPGGLLAIICPEFIECPGLPPSVFYGQSPRRFSQKCRRLALLDACWHLMDWKVTGPRWKRQLRQSAPGTFWINLRPRALHGADYSIDADAVYLARLEDLTWFFRQKGAAILRMSASMPNVPEDILRYNCYLLARKPDGAAQAPA